MLKLFKVTCWYSGEVKEDTVTSLVIAGNETEAKRIVEEAIWTLGGMEFKSIEEIDMSSPQLLCSYNPELGFVID